MLLIEYTAFNRIHSVDKLLHVGMHTTYPAAYQTPLAY